MRSESHHEDSDLNNEKTVLGIVQVGLYCCKESTHRQRKCTFVLFLVHGTWSLQFTSHECSLLPLLPIIFCKFEFKYTLNTVYWINLKMNADEVRTRLMMI